MTIIEIACGIWLGSMMIELTFPYLFGGRDE